MNAKTSPKSVLEIKATLLRDAKIASECSRRLAEGSNRIVSLSGGEGLAAIAERDPAEAKKIAGQIACIQAECAVDRLVADGADERLHSLAPVVIADTHHTLAEVERLRGVIVAAELGRVVGMLRKLEVFEPARLERIASESICVRRARVICQHVSGITPHGGGRRVSDGRGGVYFTGLSAGAVVSMHDQATAALAEVRSKAAELGLRA